MEAACTYESSATSPTSTRRNNPKTESTLILLLLVIFTATYLMGCAAEILPIVIVYYFQMAGEVSADRGGCAV
jgi:hypothetical protein